MKKSCHMFPTRFDFQTDFTFSNMIRLSSCLRRTNGKMASCFADPLTECVNKSGSIAIEGIFFKCTAYTGLVTRERPFGNKAHETYKCDRPFARWLLVQPVPDMSRQIRPGKLQRPKWIHGPFWWFCSYLVNWGAGRFTMRPLNLAFAVTLARKVNGICALWKM